MARLRAICTALQAIGHLSAIRETIVEVAESNREISGIAFQLDVEDAVGAAHQVAKLTETMEEKI